MTTVHLNDKYATVVAVGGACASNARDAAIRTDAVVGDRSDSTGDNDERRLSCYILRICLSTHVLI